MSLRRSWFLPLAAVLVLASCDEPTAPVGIAGEVTVRAYVDVDGNGTFSSGDQPLQGREVRLEGSGDVGTLTATTDGEGAARFSGVDPGSYVASLAGETPAGAVLSSAAHPVVVVPFQGGQIGAEFRFAYHPGELSGVLYRDDDGSGDFTEGVDTPAPGVAVTLYRGTSATGEATAVTTTDAEGRFHFERVRAGPNTLVFDAPETIEIVGGSTQQVQVQPQTVTEVQIPFEGDLLITIAEARSQGDGVSVEVEGVVLADQGTYDFGNRDTYIQDGTAGVRLWQLPTDLGLEAGDSVRVSGRMATFRNERQLDVVSLTVLGTGTIPQPRPVTGAQINSFEFDGQLAVTGPVTVVSVQVFDFDAHSVTVEDAAGTSFIVRVESPNEILPDFWEVGEAYVVTGALGRFFDDGQIKPRGFQDVLRPMDVADIREAPDGAGVFVEGVVLAEQGTYDFGNRDTYIQDATGGVRLWQLSGDLGLQAGDSVQVSGTMSTFRSERQLDVQGIVVVGTGTIPTPRPVTGAQINSFEFDGQLAVTGPVTVVSVQVFDFDAHSVTVEDGAGTSFIVRVESPNEIPSEFWEVGETYVVTGALGRFFDNGQIKPRGFQDVEEL